MSSRKLFLISFYASIFFPLLSCAAVHPASPAASSSTPAASPVSLATLPSSSASQVHAGVPFPNAAKSDEYTLEAGTPPTPIFVEHYRKVHVAAFTLQSSSTLPTTHTPTELTITARQPITQCRISPESLGLKPEVNGSRVRFHLAHPAYLVIRINDAEPLFIFAEPPAGDLLDLKDPNVRNIQATEPDASGRQVETAKIQQAIDALPAGGILYFPPGIYLTGTLRLKSDMTLYLAPGALLLGAPDPVAYPDDKLGRSLIRIDRAQRVKILGRGAIDANGLALRAKGVRGHLMKISRSGDVQIEGVWLRDAPTWNTHLIHCDRVIICGVKLLSDPELANTDGFDPDASQDVTIEKNFVYCGDDGVAVKSTDHDKLGRDVRGVTVRGNVFLTRKSALKVGTESRTARMGDILFEDNDVLQCDRGMSLYCNDGALYEAIRFINNRFEDCYPDAKQRLIDFSITARGGRGTIRNVLIQDCRAKQPFPQASSVSGLDSAHKVSGVRIQNLKIAGLPCRIAGDVPLKVGKYVTPVEFAGGIARLD